QYYYRSKKHFAADYTNCFISMHQSLPPSQHYAQMTDLPFELIEQIFRWIRPQDVWKLGAYPHHSKPFSSPSFITMNLRRFVDNHAEFASPESWEALTPDVQYWKSPEPYQTAYIRNYRSNLKLLSWGVDSNFDETLNTQALLGSQIPRQLCLLEHITILNINGCQLTGQIPTEIENLVSLTRLDLHNNLLEGISGTLPAELGKLECLEELYIAKTNIEGPFPEEWGQDGMFKQLRTLELSSNDGLSCCIRHFGRFSELRYLDLSYCNIVQIPRELGQLLKLETLDISYNCLVGEVPFELSTLQHLEKCDLIGNEGLSCSFVFPRASLDLKIIKTWTDLM
ncbi:L domain-like protein, partial [Rhizoclosmatium globosum]